METKTRLTFSGVLRPTGRNAYGFFIGAAAGAVIAAACFFRVDSARPVAPITLCVVFLGLAICAFCALTTSIAVARRTNYLRKIGTDFARYASASKRMQRQNALGSLLLFGGIGIGALQQFGILRFAPASALEGVAILIGFLIQLYSQAGYLRALE